MTPPAPPSPARSPTQPGIRPFARLALAAMLGVASLAPTALAMPEPANTSPPGVPAIVPNPLHEVVGTGVFRLTATTRLRVPARAPGADRAAREFRRWLGRSTGLRLAPPAIAAADRSNSDRSIRFVRRDRRAIPREGYRLVVSPRGITIEASGAAGWRYGAASLWQLVPPRRGARTLAVPAVRIDDAPRFPVRALELRIDGYRPSPREIRRLDDLLTILKLDRLDARTPPRSGTLDLDTRQSRAADEPPGLGRVLTLAEVYRASPASSIGLRVRAGTAWLGSDADLERRLLPRLAALAEVDWSAPARRDWRDFLRRMVALERHTRALGLRASRAAFRVRPRVAVDFRAATALVRLSTQTGVGEIRYTLAGGTPRADAARYQSPLRLRLPVTLRAADFLGSQRIGPVLTRRLTRATAQRRTSAQLALCSEHRPLWIEGEPSAAGVRTTFLVDAANPCWVYRAADLDVARQVRVAIGRVRFAPAANAAARRSPVGAGRSRPVPSRAPGDLVIRLDGCAGAPLARWTLPRVPTALAVLPAVTVPATIHGLHDLCVRLPPAAQGEAWALAWIALERAARSPPR